MGKAKEKKMQQDWNEISGIMKVYGNKRGKGKSEFIAYSTSVATKDDDGEYVNAYLSTFFSKACDVSDLAEGGNWIRVNRAFITVEYYQDKNNNLVVKPAIMIMDCEVLA